MKDNWTGPHDDSAPVGNGITVLQNVFTGSKREIQRRPGWTLHDTFNVNKLFPISDSLLAGSNGTTVTKYNLAASTKTDIGSFGNPSTWANLNGATYITDGTNNSVVYSTGVRAMGLSAPSTPTVTSTSTTGTPTEGIHLIRTRQHLYDSVFNRYSDPSDFVTVEFRQATLDCSVSGGNVTITVNNAGSGYKPGGTYTVTITGDGSSAAATVTMTNNSLNNGISTINLSNDGSGYTYATATIVAPNSKTQVNGTNKVEVTLANGSIYYAIEQSGNTEYNISDNEIIGWENTYFYAGPDGFGHEPPPTGSNLITAHRNRLFLWGTNLLYWSRAGYPESWKPSEWARKLSAQGSDLPTAMFSMYDDLYLCTLRGMKRFVYVSDPANGMIIDLPSNLGTWNQDCVVNAEGRIFGFGPNGVWEVKGIKPNLIGHVLDNQWRPICDFERTRNQAFGYYDAANRRVVWYYVKSGDTTCKVGQCIDIETGIFSMITTTVSVKTACQGILNYTNQAFAITDSGDMLQQSNVYTDNNSAITTKIVSDWNPGGEFIDRRRVFYIHFETLPSVGAATYKVRYYLDGSATPYSIPEDMVGTLPDGVTFNPAIPTELLVIPVKGFAAVPAPTEFSRYIRFEVESTDTTNEIRLLDCDFEWDNKKSGSEA